MFHDPSQKLIQHYYNILIKLYGHKNGDLITLLQYRFLKRYQKTFLLSLFRTLY